jgi:outer membrane lipoprotein carrier protein
MKSFFILLLTGIIGLSAAAQQDEKAKAILDQLSAKTKAYKTIKAEFQFTLSNAKEKINETQLGNIEIKGEKYFLSIKGQDVLSDGKSISTILKDASEVQINSMPEEDEEGYISPNKIFSMYETGFKYKYLKEENGLDIINLYPIKAEEKAYHRIVLYISKAKNEITKVIVHGKDASTTTYTIKSFTTNINIPDTKFTFDKTKYPKFEIIDLRD